MPRIVILTEGKSTPNDAKTATGLSATDRGTSSPSSTRPTRARRPATCSHGRHIPFIAKLGDVKGDTLLIGIAPAGGKLQSWRASSATRSAARWTS